ncbi:TolC family protein [Porticoccaceae bacterium LTM1]|nr:TolC family protein [Porticoccaceae bacterium LTM1]
MPSEAIEDQFDLRDGVSLQEAQLIALLFNPELARMRIAAELPLVGKSIRSLWPDPELELEFEPVSDAVNDDWLLNAKLGVALPLSFRLGTELKKADSQYQAELAKLIKAEKDQINEIEGLWVKLYVVEQKRQVMKEHLAGLEEIIGRAGQSLSLATITAADLQSLALNAASVKLNLLDLHEMETEFKSQLLTRMGLKLNAPIKLQLALPHPVEGPVDSQWSELLQANNPDILIAAANYEVAEQSLKLEIKKQYPDLIVGPIYQEGESGLGLNLTSLLPLLNGNTTAIERAKTIRDATRVELEGSYQQSINALHSIQQRLDLLQEREAFINDRINPMLDQQFENIWQSIQLGTTNILLLTDALKQRLDNKLALLELNQKRAILQNQKLAMLTPVQKPLLGLVARQQGKKSEGDKE